MSAGDFTVCVFYVRLRTAFWAGRCPRVGFWSGHLIRPQRAHCSTPRSGCRFAVFP